MIEKDLLTSVRTAEESSKEIIENVKGEVNKLWKELDTEKSQIVKKLESEMAEKIEAEKIEAEKTLEDEANKLEEEKAINIKNIIETSRIKQPKLAEEILSNILNRAN